MLTPTVRPLLPVVFVCCPRTRSLSKSQTDVNTMSKSIKIMSSKGIPPVVAKASVGANLLKPFQVFSQFVFETIGGHLRELSVFDVFLSVEKPVGNLVLTRICHNCHQFLDLLIKRQLIVCSNNKSSNQRSIPPLRSVLRPFC